MAERRSESELVSRPILAPPVAVPPEALPPESAPPQFRLRTLFLVMTGLGVVFALMAALGPLSSAVLTMFLLLVAAHVFGNALGTRLNNTPRWDQPAHVWSASARHAQAPVQGGQRLRERTGISRLMIIMAAAGACCGACGGGLLLFVVLGDRATIAALGLGTLSMGVLGGFLGFTSSSFLSVVSRALEEALSDPARVSSGRSPGN